MHIKEIKIKKSFEKKDIIKKEVLFQKDIRRIKDMTLKQFLDLPENKVLAEGVLKAWTGISSDNRNLNINFINTNSEIKLKWKCLEGKHYYIKSMSDVLNHGLSCDICEKRKKVFKKVIEPVEIIDANGNKRIIPKGRVIGLKSIEALKNNKEKLKKNNLYDWIKANGEHGKQILKEFTGITIDGEIHRIEDLTIGKAKEKFYWVCQNNPNHVYPARIRDRTYRGSGCPTCSKIRSGTGYEEQFLFNTLKLMIPETENNKIMFIPQNQSEIKENEYKGGLEYDISIPYKDKFILIEYGNTFTHNESKIDQVKRDQIKKTKALLNNCKFIRILDDSQSEYPEKWEDNEIILKISKTTDKEDRLLKITKFILENFNISTEPLDNPETIQKIKDTAWKNSRGAGLSYERSLESKHPILAKEILPELNDGLTARDLMPNSHDYINFKCRNCGNEWPARLHDRVNKKTGCPRCGYNPFKEEKNLPQKIKPKYKH